MMRKLMTLAAVAALGGCAGVGTGGFAYKGGAILDAEPRPVLSGAEYDYDDEEGGEPFIKFGARGGLVLYGGASGVDPISGAPLVNPKPRLIVGGYGRMLESEAKRVEVSIEIAPDIENIDRNNLSIAFGADYVGFISDLLYWKAGGIGVWDMQDEENFFIMAIEGGVGLWFPVGGGEEEEEVSTAVVVNFMLQIPVSAGAENTLTSKAYFAITGGYEF